MPNEITMISTLPPIVGLSPYTSGLVRHLSKTNKIFFLGFNHLYPEFLYPGTLRDDTTQPLEQHKNLVIHNVLNWYNPFQWIIEAFKIRTKIIHAQWWSYPLALIYWTILGINKLRGKKIILTIHNVIPHEKSLIKNFLNRSIFSLGDDYIVHTQENKKELQALIKNKPIHVIPHGPIENPLKGISREEARKTLNIPLAQKVLLCFGHIRDYKGLDVALESLARIEDPAVVLLVAGKCWEDWGKYEQLINDLNIKERVVSKIGYIDTEAIEVFFRACDLILLPYKHFNAQSGVGALVLPYKIPMIVSQVGGLPAYVRDDHCLVKPNDPDDLAQKITVILEDRQLYEKLAQDEEFIYKNLSWPSISQKTQDVYEKIKLGTDTYFL